MLCFLELNELYADANVFTTSYIPSYIRAICLRLCFTTSYIAGRTERPFRREVCGPATLLLRTTHVGLPAHGTVYSQPAGGSSPVAARDVAHASRTSTAPWPRFCIASQVQTSPCDRCLRAIPRWRCGLCGCSASVSRKVCRCTCRRTGIVNAGLIT